MNEKFLIESLVMCVCVCELLKGVSIVRKTG